VPTYEYDCRKCGYRFEAFHGAFEAPVKSCPKCKGRVKKLISAGGGIIVKRGAVQRAACGLDRSCPGCPKT